ncbi:hypothetical protein HBI91_224420 [Parastagonospora nodorum]|nr:hypothetical protein HBI91_224420 [Parastagonospora nodorum]
MAKASGSVVGGVCFGKFGQVQQEAPVMAPVLADVAAVFFESRFEDATHPEPIRVSRIAASLVELPLSHPSAVLVGWKATVAILVADWTVAAVV